MNFNKNDLIDSVLKHYYLTFENTLDTADYVPEKFNSKIHKYIFKNMKKSFKKIDKEDRVYQKKVKKELRLEKRLDIKEKRKQKRFRRKEKIKSFFLKVKQLFFTFIKKLFKRKERTNKQSNKKKP